jgi:uncharacterized membrane protein
MDWLRDAGAFGQVVVAASLSLLVAGIAALRGGCTQRMALALLVLSVLPCAIGFAGLLAEMTASNQQIETLRAPTPRDLAGGIHRSMVCLWLGLAGSAVCGLLALVAFLRTSKPEGPPPIEP